MKIEFINDKTKAELLTLKANTLANVEVDYTNNHLNFKLNNFQIKNIILPQEVAIFSRMKFSEYLTETFNYYYKANFTTMLKTPLDLNRYVKSFKSVEYKNSDSGILIVGETADSVDVKISKIQDKR